MTVEGIPYWAVNAPRDERSTSCPEYLVNISEKNKRILGTKDEDFRRHTWPELQTLIKTNRIDLLQRLPSDLRRYLEYMAKLVREYGTVMNFVVKERLLWTDMTPRGSVPFSHPDDYKILYNDWPYGIDERVVHLVVWTKFDLEDDPAIDDLTPQARKQIDEFVQQTFCQKVNPEHVIWFKNWRSLKSLHAVEHFHVMLYGAHEDFLKEVTRGDVPMIDKVR